MSIIWSAICLGFCLGACSDVKMLNLDEYNDLAQHSELQIIYFKKELELNLRDDISEHEVEPGMSTYDDRMLGVFYKEYSKSAKVLAEFNIQLYMVNCDKVNIGEYCKMKDSHHNVYIFRKGNELLNFSLDSMFDVDAIVSNILQIALLREVPILQSLEERQEYENEFKGKDDIVFSLQMAIGTKQHRALMEVAFKFKNKFKFAITTEAPTAKGLLGLPKGDEAAVWLLQCKTSQSSSCPAARYYGSMTTEGLTQFLDNSLVDNKVELTPANIDVEPFPNTNIHHVYVFYDDDSSEFVRTHSDAVLKKFRGSIGIIFVNVEHVTNPYNDLLGSNPVPTVAFKDSETGNVIFMPNNMEPEDFIQQELEKLSGKMSQSHSEGKSYISDLDDPTKYLSEVEKQDDEVALAMSRLRNQFIDDTSLLTLTDKTFSVETTTRDLLIVLFYLPFDAMSSAVRHSFLAAANMLVENKKPNPLSSVNCYDWTDVCKKENITSWPVIRVYRKGHQFKLHKMVASPENVLRTVSLYQLPAPLEIDSMAEFKQIIAGKILDSPVVVDVVAVGLVKSEYSNEAKLIDEVASELHGYMVVSMANGDLAQKISAMKGVPMPSLVIFKMDDQFQPQVVTNVGDKTSDELVSWIKQTSVSIFSELSPTNLPLIYARKQPIVIYFTDPVAEVGDTMETYRLLGKLAARGEFPDVTFTWMDKSKSTTQEVMASYTGSADKESLVTVILSKGEVFVYTDKLTDVMSIEKWLRSIMTNNLEPSKMLPVGEWKPRVPPYNFVKLVEEDNAYHKERDRIGHQLASDEEITLLPDANQDNDELPEEDLLIKNDDFTKSDVNIESHSASETVTPDVGHNEL